MRMQRAFYDISSYSATVTFKSSEMLVLENSSSMDESSIKLQ